MLLNPIALLMLLGILTLLGFILAWVTNVVAGGEMEVKIGVAIFIVARIITYALQAGLGESFPAIGGAGVNLVVLAAMIWLIGKVEFLKALIIAAVFSAVLFVVGLALT